ncbi:MAG: AAA family ATPase [Acidobacteriota bacterium]|nr:MAG: AAA family ATPase [Acidobacteriota bacterium]
MSYLEYWGLDKNPFDSVPDPTMYFSSHSTVESTVAELLFAIDEGNECLAVVVSEVGLGKTMALRVVLNELNIDRFDIAFITNPDLTFVQLLREIVGQLKGEKCLIRDKETLLEAFNQHLFEAADQGRKVLVFIDEGSSMRGPILESLRLLTNMQEDDRNLMTIVIAGQPKLARMLKHPRRENLFQRIGVYCRLQPLDSVEAVQDYVDHRLERAGIQRQVFEPSAYEVIFKRSRGVPRLINRLCKLALKSAETNQLATVPGELITRIDDRFKTRKRRSETPTDTQKEDRTLVEPVEFQEVTMAKPVEQREDAPGNLPPHVVLPDQHLTGPATAAPSKVDNRSADPPQDLKNELVSPTAPSATAAQNGKRQMPPGEDQNGRNLVSITDDWKIPRPVFLALCDLQDPRSRMRLAGKIVADELRAHPAKYRDLHADPVQIWDELRSKILVMAEKTISV